MKKTLVSLITIMFMFANTASAASFTINIENRPGTIYVGDQLQAYATLDGNIVDHADLTWSVNSDSISINNSGLVTALSADNPATFSATIDDNGTLRTANAAIAVEEENEEENGEGDGSVGNGSSDSDRRLRADMFNPEAILTDIDQMASSVIALIRVVTIIFTVLLTASVGLTLYTAKDSYALEQVKSRLLFIIAGMFVIFSTEPIVKFVISIIGGP